jgi:signal transduction histidine kinase
MRSPAKRTLVPRFAFTTLAAFVAVGVALWWVLAATINERIESASQEHAEFVTHSVIAPALEEIDLGRPMRPGDPGYERLRDLVISHVLRVQFPVVRVTLWGPDGTVLFSDESRLVGRRSPPTPALRSAFGGRVVSVPADRDRPERASEGRLAEAMLVTYVPLARTTPAMDPPAVVEIDTDVDAAAVPVGRPFRLVGIALLAGLAAIYVVQLPLVHQLGRTLRAQNERLEALLRQERQTVEKLRELNRRQAQFLDVTSHELRTPLTSIAGYAKTLLQPEFRDNAATREEFLRAIERQAYRLGVLIENILAVTQLGEGVHQSGSASVAKVADAITGRLGPTENRVAVDIPDGLAEVQLDARLLELVVGNIVDNAVKFAPEGSSCRVGARLDAGEVVILVEDEGIGISEEHVGRIFDRFYQADSSTTRGHGGVGLGLYLVKTIVEGAGGTVEVDSAPGEGSRFTVRLPVADAAVERDRQDTDLARS